MKLLWAAVILVSTAFVASSEPPGDVVERIVEARERLDLLVEQVLSLRLAGTEIVSGTAQLTESFESDSKILESAAVLLKRKGLSARFHPSSSVLTLELWSHEGRVSVGATLMWFYRDGIFERFSFARMIGDAE